MKVASLCLLFHNFNFTVLELSFSEILWFISISWIGYLPLPLASAIDLHRQITSFCSLTLSNNCLLYLRIFLKFPVLTVLFFPFPGNKSWTPKTETNPNWTCWKTKVFIQSVAWKILTLNFKSFSHKFKVHIPLIWKNFVELYSPSALKRGITCVNQIKPAVSMFG